MLKIRGASETSNPGVLRFLRTGPPSAPLKLHSPPSPTGQSGISLLEVGPHPHPTPNFPFPLYWDFPGLWRPDVTKCLLYFTGEETGSERGSRKSL